MLTRKGTDGRSALLPVYPPFPVHPVSGHGSWLVDEEGNEWLDAYGGHAVASTGHSHPHVARAIAEQAGTLLFYSTAVPSPLREQLAERLAALCPDPLGRVFFCNSGAEANENALHLARKATGRTGVVSVLGGWHGRTAATLACTDGGRYEEAAARSGIPLSTRVPADDVPALERAVDSTVAAVILEPVQGLSGARDLSREFLLAARRACDAHGAALIFDEVQCGVGRTGSFFAWEQLGVAPDALALAKGLANGLPIGALLVADTAPEGFEPGDHGSTFGGNAVVCAAAGAVVESLDEALLASVRERGTELAAGLSRLPGVVEVRGRGLMLGAELDRPAGPVVAAALEAGLLVGSAGETVLRLTPPLTIESDEIAAGLSLLEEVLR